jgi:flagellar biosynthesis chaperone FliJ
MDKEHKKLLKLHNKLARKLKRISSGRDHDQFDDIAFKLDSIRQQLGLSYKEYSSNLHIKSKKGM